MKMKTEIMNRTLILTVFNTSDVGLMNRRSVLHFNQGVHRTRTT